MSKVLCAMSGGIDSSVSAWLLKQAGHEVIGVFMRHGSHVKNTLPPDPKKRQKQGCCSLEDSHDARRIADMLGIPFYVLNFESDFHKVVSYFVSEYDRGVTPNPCIVCNRDLKFGRLFEYADAVGAEKIATGHYARLRQENGRAVLRRGLETRKDQSYVLFPLRQDQLERTLFPVGDLGKEEVRQIAREAGFRIAEKPESMEICFVPDNDYRHLIEEKIPERIVEGNFVSSDGKVLGRHRGHQFYTVGQRKGLGVALGHPMYVVDIDPLENRVVLGESKELLGEELFAREMNWIRRDPVPGDVFDVSIQIRAQHSGATGQVEVLSGGRARAKFSKPQKAITPGQGVVFYEGDTALGGGWIESKREQSFTL